jgi:hypothetical protein
MTAWVVCALCALIIIKPQEFVPALAGLPLLYIAFGIALLSSVLDMTLRRLRPQLAPAVLFVLAFAAWALLTTAVKRPDALAAEASAFAILVGIFAAVALGTASRQGLMAFLGMFLGCALLATAVAIAQSNGPFGCFLGAEDDWEGKGELAFDGRPCESALDCRNDAAAPGVNYRCERVGPLSTSTIGGRVRYRGSLADPNELSLMISSATPFILAIAERRRRATGKEGEAKTAPGAPTALPLLVSDRLLRRVTGAFRALPAMATLATLGFAVILARSRSGVLTFLLVLGLCSIRKVGVWGVIAGCFVAPPMLFFGGRSGAEADASSDERVLLLREGFDFIRNTRGIGLGAHQFPGESSIGLTAHNAYILALAETGIVGFFLFGFAVYLSLKIPYALWFGGYRLHPLTATIAPALAIALSGAAVGIFFLSWTYKDILYMLLGASAALYGVARAEDPSVRVGLSLREALLVAGGLVAMVGGVYVGVRLHR